MNVTRRKALLSLAVLTATPFLGGSATAADLVQWCSLHDGEAEAKRSGKPVLYFLTAEWCGPCHMMRRAVFADPVAASLIHAQFVPIEVIDRQRETGRNPPEVDAIFAKFGLQGFPTLAVSRPGSNATVVRPGWSSKQAILDFLAGAGASLAEREKMGKKA